jgi:amidase
VTETSSSRSALRLSAEEVEESARRLGFLMDTTEAAQAVEWVERTLRVVVALDSSSPHSDERVDPREFRWATREEDPFNAFITFCDVRGNPDGPLDGVRVAIKDCIAVAGIPLTDGGGRRPYPVPSRDAVVVERLLSAGADIVGKTNMEDMAMGSGVGSHFGPTKNPRNPRFQAGGSSSGSAAAVGADLADVALGTDQAGSVRIPAAWCGLVGMKPTHGWISTEGISHMDPTLDHVGPITRDVATNIRVLTCLSEDRVRHPDGTITQSRLTTLLSEERRSAAGIRVGIVAQSVSGAPLDDELRRAFEHGISALRDLGASVRDADVPLWLSALPIYTGVVAHGLLGTWTAGGCGFGIAETVDNALVTHAPIRRHLHSRSLPPRVVTRLLLATHVHRHLGGEPITRALNRRWVLARQINACFEEFDLLVTPTVSKVADPLPEEPPSRGSLVFGDRADLLNTVPLDLSGNPALTIPCGTATAGLPVGFQVIGPFYGEPTIYRVALALETVLSRSQS